MNLNKFSIKPINIYVYIRVSTISQKYKSNGLEDQCKICDCYLKNNFPKKEVVKYYTDIGSSYNEKNILTNLNKLIKEVSLEKNSLILVRDISRLGRNSFQVFNLLNKVRKADSNIIGIDENLCWNYSRLMDRKFSHAIIDSEEDSDHKSINQSNRIKKIKSKGGYVGRTPFGTQIIKINNIPYIYKNPNEINMLKNIKNEYLKSFDIEKTTKYFNDKNIINRGKKWSERQISNILKKYFPDVILNKNSDLIDNYFNKYKDYEENINVNELSDTIQNINLQTKSRRKYIF